MLGILTVTMCVLVILYRLLWPRIIKAKVVETVWNTPEKRASGGVKAELQDTPDTTKIDLTPNMVKQPFDAFLVLDVEATCVTGSDFNWPNEIIVRASLRRVRLTCLYDAGMASVSIKVEK